MIYSVNFLDMTEKLNPLAVCKYLEQTNWTSFPFNRSDVKIYQCNKNDNLIQVMVPMNKSFSDYKRVMYDVVKNIAYFEEKSLEQVMLYLLNPNTDILKIRLEKGSIEAGNILFDDAIKLYDNAKKLLAATALDIINPKKIHFGRIDDTIQSFLNHCRFGQTEIGSYVVSVVCPFAELSEEEGYKQLSIFTDEERCAQSLTRQVTKKLMDNVAFIKQQIDNGKEETLVESDIGISSNFFEALNGLNLHSENTLVEFSAQWAPAVKINRSKNNFIKVTNDYYQPIASIIDKIKEDTNQRTDIIGRIKRLSAVPTVDERKGGTVVIASLSKENKVQSITVRLSKEDYENAVIAHQHGKVVRIVGTLLGTTRLKMEDAIFSVLE
ncbi:hypothetical protein [Ruminococcus flavefaciens]|uniref:hypothetical protein n=1 Tax=Ruminococcus flavefaciens TaxID=1265 RepID=UPI0026E91D1E|nr:hypothetical protein [Ruminococcus flavefaciens]